MSPPPDSPTEGPIRDISHPGLKMQGDDLHSLRGRVSQLLDRNNNAFPGAQPVSFARQHLAELMRQDYYVCEKSDGIRYLLFMTCGPQEHPESYFLIDRKNDYWLIEKDRLHFPLPTDEANFHESTIIDGELVLDDLGSGRKVARFLVFDCLVLDGDHTILGRPLDKRLAYLSEMVIKPYKNLLAKLPVKASHMAFEVKMKEMQFAYGVEKVLHELPTLRHGNDGLIFTCRSTPYQFGTDPHILKWKPRNDNTVDFRLQLVFPLCDDGEGQPYPDYDSVPTAMLMVFHGKGGKYEPFESDLYLQEEEWETLKGLGDPLQGRIIECGLDEEGRWRLHRFRDDKHEANHASTVESVLKSIRDSVSVQDLVSACGEMRDNWKARASGLHKG